MSESEQERKQEDKKPNEEAEKPEEHAYEMKGIPIRAYLVENGEFKWIPSFKACCNKNSTERIIEVLKKMPPDRRAVWTRRLDLEEAKIACPVIRTEVDLCKQFDDLCAAYTKPLGNRPDEKRKGGESSNE